jgi:hypothetical protein
MMAEFPLFLSLLAVNRPPGTSDRFPVWIRCSHRFAQRIARPISSPSLRSSRRHSTRNDEASAIGSGIGNSSALHEAAARSATIEFLIKARSDAVDVRSLSIAPNTFALASA